MPDMFNWGRCILYCLEPFLGVTVPFYHSRALFPLELSENKIIISHCDSSPR